MSEVNDVSPSSLSHLIGQRAVVAQDPGCPSKRPGLTARAETRFRFAGWRSWSWARASFAQVIASEMAADLHEVLGQSVTSAADLNALLLSAKDKDVVHVDEVHELQKVYQTGLCKHVAAGPAAYRPPRRQGWSSAEHPAGRLDPAAVHD